MRCTISQLYLGKELYMFRTDLLFIIRIFNTVFTATGICHTSYVESLSETCRVVYQNKVEKWCILLAFIIRIYHDARSS